MYRKRTVIWPFTTQLYGLYLDINQKTIDSLQSGKVNIEEPGLQEVFEEVLEAGKLKVSTQPAEGGCFHHFSADSNNDDEYESCDISIVLSAVNSVLPHLKKVIR